MSLDKIFSSICITRVLEIRPSFWLGPQVFVAYANKNVVILF